jgi:hypothetical protein
MDPRTPPTPTDTVAARRRDWIETAIVWASGLGAVAMFAYGVALSYSVLHQIATAAGLGELGARAWPLGWELFMASAALNVLAEQRHLRTQPSGWQRVPWYPWALTGLTAGGSILLNWFHPAIPLNPPPGWLVSLVYGLPPLEAVLAGHLFLQRIAHRRHPPADPAASPSAPSRLPPLPQPPGPATLLRFRARRRHPHRLRPFPSQPKSRRRRSRMAATRPGPAGNRRLRQPGRMAQAGGTRTG